MSGGKTFKPKRNQKGASNSYNAEKDKGASGGDGIGGTNMPQTSANLYRNTNEYWRSNPEKSAHIIIGRDLGGGMCFGEFANDDQAGSIYLCAGPSPLVPFKYPDNTPGNARPHALSDAASITISQKSRPNQLGGLVLEGSPGATAHDPIKVMSTVRACADSVILFGNEYVKVVTRAKASNSQDGNVQQFGKIELISNNDASKLQPMIKGTNLSKAMHDLYSKVHSNAAILNHFLTYQLKFNKHLTNHFHITQWYGTNDFPSIVNWEAGVQCSLNLMDTSKSSFNQRVNLDNSYQRWFKSEGEDNCLSVGCYLT